MGPAETPRARARRDPAAKGVGAQEPGAAEPVGFFDPLKLATTEPSRREGRRLRRGLWRKSEHRKVLEGREEATCWTS